MIAAYCRLVLILTFVLAILCLVAPVVAGHPAKVLSSSKLQSRILSSKKPIERQQYIMLGALHKFVAVVTPSEQ